MLTRKLRLRAAALTLACASPLLHAAEPPRGIEQALNAALDSKKGVTLLVAGQQVGGGVVRVEPGQFVEMKSQQYGRIVVRIDRIDAILMP